MKLFRAVFVMLILWLGVRANAQETVYAQEIESFFYADGQMKRGAGQFEITYLIEGDKVTRTRVFDVRKKEVIPDDTIYQIQRQLSSDPEKEQSVLVDRQVIRAIGQPGLDAVEILVIGETFVQSVKSTSGYFVISRSKRIN